MAKKLHDAKAKAKRQKIMAAGGAVLLLALLAIQVPRTMKMMNAEVPPAPPPAAAAPTSADPSVLPTPSSATASAPAPSSTTSSVTQSDVAPSPAAGQLISFGRFSSKDPFAEQIDPDAPTPVAGGSASGADAEKDAAQQPKAGEDGSVVGSPSNETPTPSTAGSAVIAVNGVEETVAVKGEFPKDEPVFRLVALKGAEARVGIAGGKFASGAPTVTLRLGKAITLVNTADGTRYELKLVALG